MQTTFACDLQAPVCGCTSAGVCTCKQHAEFSRGDCGAISPDRIGSFSGQGRAPAEMSAS